MVIEKVEMTSGKPIDFCQGVVHALRVETLSALKESVLVAEVAVLRAPTRNHYRVRHKITAPLDQVPAGLRHTLQCAPIRRCVDPLRVASTKVGKELRERLL